MGEVWEARGPCPGLGAALTAFGIQEGVLLAFAAQSRIGDNEDPWPLVDAWLRDPASEPEASARVSAMMSKAWAAIPDERRVACCGCYRGSISLLIRQLASTSRPSGRRLASSSRMRNCWRIRT